MRIARWVVVTIGSLVLTTLGINAFDNLDQPASSLIGSAIVGFRGETGKCPKDMAYVATSGGGFCIDAYEAAPNAACAHGDPQNKRETDDNLALSGCKPVSEAKKMPWRNISRQQAELACARAGKRLPTNEEWYRAALGTPDKEDGWGARDCNVRNPGANGPDQTGMRGDCVSPAGAYDMIGNVWEWLEETADGGVYDGRELPDEGYVTSIGENGMPIETDFNEPDPSLFSDYFWVDKTETRGMFRGGYWNSQSDAGQYALNVTVPPSFIGVAVGFRCVKDL